MSLTWTSICTIYVAILAASIANGGVEGLVGCLRSILWLCVKGPMGCLASLASSLWPYVCSAVKGLMGCLRSLASSLWPYVCSVVSEVAEEATNVLNHPYVKGLMGCLTSLASSLWPYVCSAASEVAECAGLDKEEATDVCMDAENCGAAWAVVAILGLFIYCQFCWQRVRRMCRKRSPKKQILTTRPVHIQGSTLHKPPSKHGSWTNYWKAVMKRKDLPKRCPCRGTILKGGKGGNVHGAHVLFQDRMGNYYGGIVPVSNTANRRGSEIVDKCDIVTVLNFGQMTFEGKLMTNEDFSVLLEPKEFFRTETSYNKVSYKKERQFNSILRVRSGQGEPRIIVEGFVGGLVKKQRIESTYTHHGAANKYIYQLAQAHLQQTEELNYLSREHEPKIFKFRPGPRPQPSIWRWFINFTMTVIGEIGDLTYLLVCLILADLIRLVFGILLILLFVRFSPFFHKDSFPQQTFDARE